MPEVTTYYLQTLSPGELVASPQPAGFDLRECVTQLPEFNRFLYELIGNRWHWQDKLVWSESDWRRYIGRENLRTWVVFEGATPAGYYELEKQDDNRVEIAYFGLVPVFIGRGLGGFLLSSAIENGWSWGATSIIVNTCTLDHPAALHNYQARGMKIYRRETENKYS